MSAPEMYPIPGYWDPSLSSYLIDLPALLNEIPIPVLIEDARVKAVYNDGTYEIDFDQGTVTNTVDQDRIDSLEVDGYLHSGDRFLLTPANLQKAFPEGMLSFDISRMLLKVSWELFTKSGFKERSLSLEQSSLLHGRYRKLIGGIWTGYHISRTQRPKYTAVYNGAFDIRANMLWGQIRMDASATHIKSTSTSVRQASYLLDFPESPWATQIELGRIHEHNWVGREMYEGIRISNHTLSTRHQQREIRLSGVAEPNAIVSALVAGVVADRVQADEQGRYQLHVPAYYGTFQAELEIIPESGGPPRREPRSLFIAEELVPAGRLYYNLQGGQTQFGKDLYGHAHISYGVTPTFTALGSVTYQETAQTATLGGSNQITDAMTASVEFAYPARAVKASMRLFLKQIQLQTNAIFADDSKLSLYKQRLTGSLGWSAKRLSVFVHGNHVESFGGRVLTYAQASSTVRIGRRVNLILAGGPRSTRYAQNASRDTRIQWRSLLAHYLTHGVFRGKVGIQADGGHFESLDFAGGTLSAVHGSVSLGARVGYDNVVGGMTASLSLRVNAPWTNFASHSSLDSDNPYNQQSLYGSMILDDGLALSKHTHPWSSASLQPFLDTNRDGQKNIGEAFLDGLDIQVMRASTKVDALGGIQADFLAPSTRYQVLINPRSTLDPRFNLPNGTAFSFISDPLQRKRIYIPAHENTIVSGSVENLPLSSPTLAVVVFYQGDHEVARSAISQTGKFSLLLPPGTYRVELIDLLGQEDLSTFTQILNLEFVSTYDLEIR